MLPIGAATTPSWVLSGAKFDIDFANNRWWGGNISEGQGISDLVAIGSLLLGPGNSIVGYAPDINGIVQIFPTFAPRITQGRGLWAEGRYTNSALWCRDLTNAVWAATTMTVAKNKIGADNVVNAASSLTASAPLATVLQTITLGSTLVVGSAYVKRLTGVGTVSMTIDGTTYTDITALINSTTYTKVSVLSQTLVNPIVGFQLSTSGDAIIVDFVQLENNTYSTTPLPTTSATVFRGSEEPTIGQISGGKLGDGFRLIRNIICNGGPWSIFISGSGNTAPGLNTILTDGGFTFKLGTGGEAATMRGVATGNTATSVNSGNFGLYNINKAMGRVGSNGNSICLNAGSVTFGTLGGSSIYNNQSTVFTHMGIGNNGPGLMPIDGYISRFAFWNHEVTNGQMIEFTR